MAGFVRVSGYSKTDLDNARQEGHDAGYAEGRASGIPSRNTFSFECRQGETYYNSWSAPKSGTLNIYWCDKCGPGSDSGWSLNVGGSSVISRSQSSMDDDWCSTQSTRVSVSAGQNITVYAHADDRWYCFGVIYMIITI